jgi:GMP synthase (glutamine-hydrolysing)
LIAHALGGEVGYHPKGPEMGTVPIHKNQNGEKDALLGSLPTTFSGHVTHYQTILQPPKQAVILAHNHHEPYHAMRIGSCAWGVQFHPEFDAAIMRSYIEHQKEKLESLSLQPQLYLDTIQETPIANQLLKQFAGWVKIQSMK